MLTRKTYYKIRQPMARNVPDFHSSHYFRQPAYLYRARLSESDNVGFVPTRSKLCPNREPTRARRREARRNSNPATAPGFLFPDHFCLGSAVLVETIDQPNAVAAGPHAHYPTE